jgi:hypothetical protein
MMEEHNIEHYDGRDDAVLDAVEAWHLGQAGEDQELHEYLGLTWEEYAVWAMDNIAPDGWKPPVPSTPVVP